MTQPQHGTRALESLGRVHFIGIGGVGMSAVARIMVCLLYTSPSPRDS